MIFEPETLDRRILHELLGGVVSPRPIAWVSTLSAEGRPNLAPFSFFNAFSVTPPIVAIGPGSRKGTDKDTLRNIRETGEFVVSVVTEDLADFDRVVLLCGRYEGVDERVREGLADREVSVGDMVVTGGELPAMVTIDAVSRFVPGVLGRSEAAEQDSFADGQLDSPYYTRPPEFRGLRVPEELLSGDHAMIERWRRRSSEERTRRARPDLIDPEHPGC